MTTPEILNQIAAALSLEPDALAGLSGPPEALSALLAGIERLAAPTQALSAGDVARIEQLLASDDYDHHQQALALLQAAGDEETWGSVVQGCYIDDVGRFVSAQTRPTHGLFQAFCLNPFADHGDIASLSLLGLSWLNAGDLACLSRFPALTRLAVDGAAAGADLAPLAALSGLTWLSIAGAGADAGPVAGLTGLTALRLRGCRPPADLSRLTRLETLETPPRVVQGTIAMPELPALGALAALVVTFESSSSGYARLEGGRYRVTPDSDFDLSGLAAAVGLTDLTIELELPRLGAPGALDAVWRLDALRRLRVGAREISDYTPNNWLLTGGALTAYQATLRCYVAVRDDDARELEAFSDLRSLDLSGATLTQVDGLARLTRLERVDLKGCDRLGDLDGLADLPALAWLDIDYRPPKDAPRYVNPCSSGGYLGRRRDLRERGYVKAFTNREAVETYQDTLRLHRALRSGDPARIAPFSGAEHLSLTEWRGRDIEALRHLPRLRSLDLRGASALTSLAPLAELSELRSLNIAQCPKIEELPRLSAQLESLTAFGCGLRRIAPGDHLSALTELSLTDCERLEDLDGLRGAVSLTRLQITQAPIRDLRPLAGLVRLERLELSRSAALRTLDGLEGLTGLKQLDVSRSESLVNIDALAGLNRLERLLLHGCVRLRRVGALAGLEHLTALWLAYGAKKGGTAPIPSDAPLPPFPPRSPGAIRGSQWTEDLHPGYWTRSRPAYQREPWRPQNFITRYRMAIRELQGTLPPADGPVAVALSVADIPRHRGARQLDLSGLPITDLEILRDFRELQALYIDDCEALTDVSAVADLPALARVEARKSRQIRPEIKAPLRSREAVAAYQLQLYGQAMALALTSNDPLATDRLSALIDALTARLGAPLTTLDLSRQTRIRSLEHLAGIPGLMALEEVDLTRCAGLTDIDGILGYPALRKVKLGYCGQMDTRTLSSARAVAKYRAKRGVAAPE